MNHLEEGIQLQQKSTVENQTNEQIWAIVDSLGKNDRIGRYEGKIQ